MSDLKVKMGGEIKQSRNNFSSFEEFVFAQDLFSQFFDDYYAPLITENEQLKEEIYGIKSTIINHERAYDHLSLEYKKLDDSFGELQNENTELKRKLAICEKVLKQMPDSCVICKNCPQEDDGECAECNFEVNYEK